MNSHRATKDDSKDFGLRNWKNEVSICSDNVGLFLKWPCDKDDTKKTGAPSHFLSQACKGL